MRDRQVGGGKLDIVEARRAHEVAETRGEA